MIIDIFFQLLGCVLLFIFAKNIANFVAEYTPASKIFRDTNHPITYRILAVLLAFLAIVNPLLPFIVEKLQ